MNWKKFEPTLFLIIGFIFGLNLGRWLHQAPPDEPLGGDPPFCAAKAYIEQDGDFLTYTLENVYLPHRPQGGLPLADFRIFFDQLGPGDVELVSYSNNLKGWDVKLGRKTPLSVHGGGVPLPPGAKATVTVKISPDKEALAFPQRVGFNTPDGRTMIDEFPQPPSDLPVKIPAR